MNQPTHQQMKRAGRIFVSFNVTQILFYFTFTIDYTPVVKDWTQQIWVFLLGWNLGFFAICLLGTHVYRLRSQRVKSTGLALTLSLCVYVLMTHEAYTSLRMNAWQATSVTPGYVALSASHLLVSASLFYWLYGYLPGRSSGRPALSYVSEKKMDEPNSSNHAANLCAA